MEETRRTEKAILVAARVRGRDGWPFPRKGWSVDSSLDELEQLAITAGAQVVGRLKQNLARPAVRSYLGEGKLKELAALRGSTGYDLVVCDDELSPQQQRHLEQSLGVKVVDRTALILDIFARRARTREGRLQVELAQHRYLLPRLTGQWAHLERLGGGIGTRGPGESQLETDRRLLRDRIHRLEKALGEVRRQRALYRSRRQQEGIPVVSLVGYTNAGKSTLFNTLTRSQVFVEDKLFATLDPTTRRLRLPGGNTVLLTDTVGFIQKLPPTLVAAFRATLEEMEEAQLLLVVVDISHPEAALQLRTVLETLQGLGLGEKPRLLVLNKVDRLAGGDTPPHLPHIPLPAALLTSALKGWGLEELVARAEKALRPSGEGLHQPAPPLPPVYVNPPRGG